MAVTSELQWDGWYWLGMGASCPAPCSSQPSKSQEGETRTARQLLATCWPHSKHCPCLARRETASGKADFTTLKASSTPRVTRAYQGKPELRRVTTAFHSLSHPQAPQCPQFYLHHQAPAQPWKGWTCSPDTPNLQTHSTVSRPVTSDALPSDRFV